jgi:glutaminyl-tRNA synthetase
MKQSVGLKYAGIVLTVQQIEKNENNLIVNLKVRQEYISQKNKPKAFIQWVSQPSLAHVRMYERL